MIHSMHPRTSLFISLIGLPLLSGCIVYPHYDSRSPEVRGRVLDADSHEPLAGARVAFSKKHSLKATTGADGDFVIKATRQWEPFLFLGICGPSCKIGSYYYPKQLNITHRGYESLQLSAPENREPPHLQLGSSNEGFYLQDILLKPLVK